jgi:methyl-accepting chemotaxis protein
MQEQANELRQQMTFFRLDETSAQPAAASPVARSPVPVPPRRTAAPTAPSRAAAPSTVGAWTEF